MKSLYLILAATTVVVTCEPQRSNNDIIWYPVDDEEGVFISTFGEKHRTSLDSKWRSHRRARYSGMEWPRPIPLLVDPTENPDPSFFHNINERRPLISKVPPFFQNQRFPVEHKRPLENQNFNENSFQEIVNEVFDFNKHPPVNKHSESKPEIITQWGGSPISENTNQWGSSEGKPVLGSQWNSENQRPVMGNQWGSTDQRPVMGNQWGSGDQRPGMANQWGSTDQRPVMGNQWGSGDQRPGMANQWGSNSGSLSDQHSIETSSQWGASSSRLTERPSYSEWITQGNTKKPNIIPNQSTNQSDKLIFPDEVSLPTTTPSNLIPTDRPTMSPCERLCPVTPEFNPVCGSDAVTYSNTGRLKCAQFCGKNVKLSHYGNCGRTSFTTPLISNNTKQKFLKL